MIISAAQGIHLIPFGADKYIVSVTLPGQSASVGDVIRLPDGQWEAKFWFQQERADTPKAACLAVIESAKQAKKP